MAQVKFSPKSLNESYDTSDFYDIVRLVVDQINGSSYYPSRRRDGKLSYDEYESELVDFWFDEYRDEITDAGYTKTDFDAELVSQLIDSGWKLHHAEDEYAEDEEDDDDPWKYEDYFYL